MSTTDQPSASFAEAEDRCDRMDSAIDEWHDDRSIQFITQTGSEFALTPEARPIPGQCSLKLIHRADEAADGFAAWFGLSEREVNRVRSGKAGDEEDGYSETLLGVDEEGWFPLRVRASPYESAMLDGEVFEPTPGESRVESAA